MSSISVLENMDTDGKRHQRLSISNAINNHFPNGSDGYIITLGGLYTDKNGKLKHGSEIYWFLEMNRWNPKRIISVDNDPITVNRNKSNMDPRCKGIVNICGNFKDVVFQYSQKVNISVVNFDSCGDAHTHGWEVSCMMDDLNSTYKGEKTLFLTNWNIKGRSTGGAYDAFDVLKKSSFHQGEREYSFHQVQRGFSAMIDEYTSSTWKHFGAEVNGKKDCDFKYVGGFNSPMQSVWFVREGNIKTLPQTKKNPVMVAAGKKAWETRRANGN